MKNAAKLKEWREKSNESLEKETNELREKLRALRFLVVQGRLKKVREVRQAKKDIAKILTILKEKKK